MPNVLRKEDLVDITPDVRLLRVLRNSGFHLQTAMGELLDNSVDAGANEIDVYVFINNLQKKNIMIVDNGKGMNESTLQYSLTLAKELKVGIDQLGKFGMGMKTAALSISTQFEILTKTFSGEVLYGEFNINKMEKLGDYKTDVRRATKEEESFFHSKLGKRKRSGTILIIKNCDRLDVTFGTFVKQMQNYIGLTYKNYINKGITFAVNDMPVKGEKIQGIDPLMRENENTYVVTERETFPVEYHSPTGQKKTTFIEISSAVLPKPDKNGKGKLVDGKEIQLPLNQTNQGIYFYREGRLVGQALNWNNVFGEKHNSKNRFRIEVNCKSDLDEEIRMNFQKGNVSPTNFLKSQLAEVIEPLMAEMRERVKVDEEEAAVEEPTSQKVDIKSKTAVTTDRKIGMIISMPGEKTKTIPNKRSRKASSTNIDELVVVAQNIRRVLENENTPQEVKDKLEKALGLVTV